MSYITEIFERANLQNIREFLLHGAECVEISEKNYKQRIDDAWKPALNTIQKKFPEMEENEKITVDIHHYASVTQDVYMEIGIKCGVLLFAEIADRLKS